MPLKQAVSTFQTLIPVRFDRAEAGPPKLDAPPVDDRGRTAVVGLPEGDTVKVAVLRQAIGDSTRLCAVSSDPEGLAVVAPPHGILPAGPRAGLQFRGVKGGLGAEPRVRRIDICYGSSTGPVLASLGIHIFRPLVVRVAPHWVRIKGTSGEAAASSDSKTVLALVSALWRPCGIVAASGAVRLEEAVFSRPGVVSDGPWSATQGLKNTELDQVLATGVVPEAINVYVVPRLASGSNVLGFTRRAAEAFQIRSPGIVVAEVDGAGHPRLPLAIANDIAHEVGHFLGLSHPERRAAPREREDAWSRRTLMHNHNPLLGKDPWPRALGGEPYAERPTGDDVGYGAGIRGALLTLTRVPGLTTDGEAERARRTLLGPGGIY